MRVQGPDENAVTFAKRLEKECEDLAKELNAITPAICVMTSASDGRQTATIQIMTNVPDSDDSVFNFMDLGAAYDKFKETHKKDKGEPTAKAYQDYLMALKRKDLDSEESGKN